MKQLRMSFFGFIVVSFLIVTFACDSPVIGPTDPDSNSISGDCNRECLMDALDTYLDALVANDPSSLNVASTLKYTDNGVVAKLGEGLWKTAVRVDNGKRLDFADPVQGNVATQVVIYENGDGSSSGGCNGGSAGTSPVIYQVRLKVAQAKITEIEAMTVRRQGAANGFFNVNNMAPEPVFNESIAPNKRMSRDELKAVLDLYVDYLEGTKSGNEVPFDQNCKRYENGVVTASGLASFRMQSWFFKVTRRYPVIDEETGIIWGMLPFFQTQNALVVGEAFKIMDGKIMMIQAVMARMPAKTWN